MLWEFPWLKKTGGGILGWCARSSLKSSSPEKKGAGRTMISLSCSGGLSGSQAILAEASHFHSCLPGARACQLAQQPRNMLLTPNPRERELGCLSLLTMGLIPPPEGPGYSLRGEASPLLPSRRINTFGEERVLGCVQEGYNCHICHSM